MLDLINLSSHSSTPFYQPFIPLEAIGSPISPLAVGSYIHDLMLGSKRGLWVKLL